MGDKLKDLSELSNSEIMKKITDIKKELENNKQILKHITSVNKIEVVEIKNTLDLSKKLNDELYELNSILLNRNYGSEITFKGKKYKPIELLKIKEKLFYERDINEIVLNSHRNEDEAMLKLSLEVFQDIQSIKNDLNELFMNLENFNNSKGN